MISASSFFFLLKKLLCIFIFLASDIPTWNPKTIARTKVLSIVSTLYACYMSITIIKTICYFRKTKSYGHFCDVPQKIWNRFQTKIIYFQGCRVWGRQRIRVPLLTSSSEPVSDLKYLIRKLFYSTYVQHVEIHGSCKKTPGGRGLTGEKGGFAVVFVVLAASVGCWVAAFGLRPSPQCETTAVLEEESTAAYIILQQLLLLDRGVSSILPQLLLAVHS